MTEGVCHPAATLARKFESLAGLLAFIHKQVGAEGLKAVLNHSPIPADYLIFAITELQELGLPALAEIVWEIAKHGAWQDELCFCRSAQFPHAWYRVPACHQYCSRLMDLQEGRRRKNLTEAGERFLAELEGGEFTEPEEGMKGEYQLYWETLQTRECLRKIEGTEFWPENKRFWEFRRNLRCASANSSA
jgi:hypothetical protein